MTEQVFPRPHAETPGRRSRVLAGAAAFLAFAAPAFASDGPAETVPRIDRGIEIETRMGGCGAPVVLRNHDGTVENAYGWSLNGVAAPNYGAFAECFVGSYSLCEVEFFFTQVGGQSGQTMDVYLWEDSGVESPGAVVALVPGVDPGLVATWPAISQHNVPLSESVTGRWWIGYWGDWPGSSAGWFIGADEDGPGGCAQTNIAPGLGYPTGWEPPNTLISWRNCRSLAIQAVVDAPSGVEGPGRDPGNGLLATVAPNPFSGTTEIRWELPRSEAVHLSVLDASGRRVATLVDGVVGAGTHRVSWDGVDGTGRSVPAGVYFVTLRSGSETWTRRLTLVR